MCSRCRLVRCDLANETVPCQPLFLKDNLGGWIYDKNKAVAGLAGDVDSLAYRQLTEEGKKYIEDAAKGVPWPRAYH